MRLKLAQILAATDRPAQALKVLAKVDAAALNPRQAKFLRKVRAKAEQGHAENPYEIADDDW